MKKEIKYTNTGYSYIECTKEECYGWGGACICDYCDDRIEDTVYLIFILGSAYCEKCFDKWAKDTRRYTEDLQFQKQHHIAYYKAHGLDVD